MDQPLKQEWTPEFIGNETYGAWVVNTGSERIACGDEKHAKALSFAHNAALAAAYTEAFIDVRSELESRIEALTQQLAAERSKVLQLESFGEQLADCQEKYNFKANLTQEIVELNKQLAAEREHRKLVDKVLDNRCLQLRKMEDQLAAECQRREQAERDIITWRSLAQEMTPGGSEFMTPDAVRAYYRRQKDETHEAKKDRAKINQQLLSAQAAIDAALKAPWTDVGQILAPIDLSALHERDAEVTEKAKKDYAPIAYRMGYECAAKEAAKVREPLVDLRKWLDNQANDIRTKFETVDLQEVEKLDARLSAFIETRTKLDALAKAKEQ